MSTSRSRGQPTPNEPRPAGPASPAVPEKTRPIRHWSAYPTIGEWWADYRGFVPIGMAHGISQVMRARGVSFAAAYRLLLEGGAIIELEPVIWPDVPEPDR